MHLSVLQDVSASSLYPNEAVRTRVHVCRGIEQAIASITMSKRGSTYHQMLLCRTQVPEDMLGRRSDLQVYDLGCQIHMATVLQALASHSL